MTVTKKYKDCVSCGKKKVSTSFYSSNSKMFGDGKVPICKLCLSKQVNEDDISTVKDILRQIDKPFIFMVWKSAYESPKDTFGNYMKIINSLPQYKNMTYDDSVDEITNETVDVDDAFEDSLDDDLGESNIKINSDVKLKFGSGYKNEEYVKMEKFYQDMMATHEITAPQHKEMLIEICKVNIQKDRTLREGDYTSYKKLSDASKTLIADAGFRPADRTTGSEATGIRTFSQIFEEIEKDGFITPVPIHVNEDILDRTIMYIQNYTRRLLNMDVLHQPIEEDMDEYIHLRNQGDSHE